MRTKHLLVGAAAVLPFSSLFATHSSRSLNIHYDKFEDLTEVSTNSFKVDDALGLAQQKRDLRLQSSYVCSGNTSHCQPNKSKLEFVSRSVGEHLHSRQLILIVDGKRIRTETKWTGEYGGAGPTTEHISADVDMVDFRQIACAELVEGKLGDTTFRLSEGNLTEMQQLANEMQ